MYNKQLDTFICAADTGSFSKAANQLYLSTSGVVRQIQLLEQHLGFPLFIRSPQGIFLTPAGHMIYRDAKEMIRFSKEAIARANSAIMDQTQQIHIVVPTDAPAEYVQRAWPKLCENSGNYELVFENYGLGLEHSDQMLLDLGKKVDLALSVYEDSRLQSRGLAAQKLFDVNVCCMTPLLHRFHSMDSITIKDLAGETVLMIKIGKYSLYDGIREELQKQADVTVDDIDDFGTAAYNRSVNEGKLLIAPVAEVPAVIKAIPLQGHTTPFGFYYYSECPERVRDFLDRIRNIEF